MATEDLLDHFKLEAEVFPNYTVHSSTRYDRRRGVREKVEVRWDRLKRVGDGVFGQVWLEEHAHSTDTRETRAVKIIDKHKMKASQIDYKKELLALAKFSKEEYRRAEVLVAFLGWFETEQDIYLAMEYFEHGDLARHIPNISTEDEVRQITTDLLEGLKIMHAEGFAHRDLKPQNIFVVEMPPRAKRWWVKIGDFGISKRVKDDSTALRTQTGTPLFWAPEICGYVNGDSETFEYSQAVDLWSLGCIVYNITAGEVPFARRYDINVFCRKHTPLAEEPLRRLMSSQGIWFVKQLLVPEPTGRMSVDRALEDIWITKLTESATSAPTDTLPTSEKVVLTPSVPDVRVDETMLSGSEDPTGRRITEVTTSMESGNSISQDWTTLATNDSANNITPKSDDFYNSALNTVTRKVSDLFNLSKGAASLLPAPGQASMQTRSASSSSPVQVWAATSRPLEIDLERPSDMDIKWQMSKPTINGWTERSATFMVNDDEQQLLCADRDKSDHVWHVAEYDLDTREMAVVNELKVEPHHKDVNCVALSPKGALIAFGAERFVTLYNYCDGSLVYCLDRHPGKIEAITFSPNGTWIATGSSDDVIRIWNGSNGQLRHAMNNYSNVMISLAFSPDEDLLVPGAGNRKMSMWNLRSKKLLGTWPGHFDDIKSVAISPSGLFIAAISVKHSVLLWGREYRSLPRVITLEPLRYSLGSSLAFSPDSALLACGSRQGAVLLFSVETGELQTILHFGGSEKGIRFLAFSQNSGTLVAAQVDGNIQLWDPVKNKNST